MAALDVNRLVLASGSPRRLALLQEAGLDPLVRIPEVDESAKPREGPEAMVERLAISKLDTAVMDGEPGVAADTVVVIDGEVLGKPRTAERAEDMLRRLSGRPHKVITGVAVSGPGGRASTTVTTTVTLHNLGETEIARYVEGGEPLDKAGGYAIQGEASRFVASVDGSRDNVIGLPVMEMLGLLATVGWAPG